MSSNDLSLAHEFHPGSPDAPVLLLLHGTGGTPGDLRELGRRLSPESAVLAPAGPVSEGGAARWFRRLAEGVFDVEDVLAQSEQLAGFVRQALEHYGIADRRVVAAGFSNGANIAAALTLRYPELLRSAVLFAAMLPIPEPPRTDLTATRVFISDGEHDPMAPVESATRLVTALRERGASVSAHWHAGGHQITPEGVRAAADWLNGLTVAENDQR